MLDRYALTRSVGAPTWALAAALAVDVGGTLLVGDRTGYPDEAGRIVLAMILVALPSVPEAPLAAVRTVLTRTAAVVAASAAVAAVGGDELVVAALVVGAAAVGFWMPSVGTTAALGLLLLGVRAHAGAGTASAPVVWELAGAVVVAVSIFAVRFPAGLLRPRTRTGPAAALVPAERPSWRVRRTAAVGAAVGLASLSPLGLFGGHWLVTAVLLSVRPTPSETRARLSQRLLGNTVAAILVACLMGVGPGAAAMGLVAGGLAFLAFALRPVSYLWWAVTAPPVLLIVGDFPQTHGWYEGVFRVALNVVGAVIVMLICLVPRPTSQSSGEPRVTELSSPRCAIGPTPGAGMPRCGRIEREEESST